MKTIRFSVEKNTITMELVMDGAHNASKPHSGGCAQYDSVNGPTYNKKRRQIDVRICKRKK